jgi:hypothetical protein
VARATVVAAALLGFLSIGVPTAAAVSYVAPVPSFPLSVAAGETAPASLGIGNFSTLPESADFPSLSVNAIGLSPSCGDIAWPCAAPDLDVVQLPPTGLGTNGPASCLGTWTITGPDAAGAWTFTPPGGEGSLLLANGEVCVVDFTFTALKAPAIDADPSAPGDQTNQVATATPSAPGLAFAFPYTGTDQMTVS